MTLKFRPCFLRQACRKDFFWASQAASVVEAVAAGSAPSPAVCFVAAAVLKQALGSCASLQLHGVETSQQLLDAITPAYLNVFSSALLEAADQHQLWLLQTLAAELSVAQRAVPALQGLAAWALGETRGPPQQLAAFPGTCDTRGELAWWTDSVAEARPWLWWRHQASMTLPMTGNMGIFAVVPFLLL